MVDCRRRELADIPTMLILRKVVSGIREILLKEVVLPTPEERQANKRGVDAYFDGWHQNPYPAGSRERAAWQEGHDAAEYHHKTAW